MPSNNPQTLQDLLVAFRQMNDIISKLTTKDIDLHGRRITGAAESVEPSDYVKRSELIAAVKEIKRLL